MEWLQSLMEKFADAFRWFYVVEPWEQALRVRAGKWIVLHHGGLHFKIPYLDTVYKQNTRLRISDIPSQTISTLDGKTITLAGGLQYRVKDITPLMMKLHTAEKTIGLHVQKLLTDHIAWSHFKDCSPSALCDKVDATLGVEEWGLTDYEFVLTDFAVVKTYRFITGDMDTWSDHSLTTDEAEDV